jgi:hypothetical protein
MMIKETELEEKAHVLLWEKISLLEKLYAREHALQLIANGNYGAASEIAKIGLK